MAVPKPGQFVPAQWAAAFRANGRADAANAMMDSGWSKAVAERCDDTTKRLLLELFNELVGIDVRPEDFFDRPKLAAILSAVHEACKYGS